ncbi:hypothetical protein WICPIJ_006414 [Wickerhamomyces pijperi]|uniref:Uncharacterized protein n=1 Tax=Wickerhamomyces pijperi TaxID=599730 RepID=A0A9P8TL04_WICPI|nr:hypothetical protein WICPIJ_006414 [Wickerhamomyces pijperi]
MLGVNQFGEESVGKWSGFSVSGDCSDVEQWLQGSDAELNVCGGGVLGSNTDSIGTGLTDGACSREQGLAHCVQEHLREHGGFVAGVLDQVGDNTQPEKLAHGVLVVEVGGECWDQRLERLLDQLVDNQRPQLQGLLRFCTSGQLGSQKQRRQGLGSGSSDIVVEVEVDGWENDADDDFPGVLEEIGLQDIGVTGDQVNGSSLIVQQGSVDSDVLTG